MAYSISDDYETQLNEAEERIIELEKQLAEAMRSREKTAALPLQNVTAMLPLLDEMSKHENEQLGKLLTLYRREKHANNKYCIAIVKSLIESRFGN